MFIKESPSKISTDDPENAFGDVITEEEIAKVIAVLNTPHCPIKLNFPQTDF